MGDAKGWEYLLAAIGLGLMFGVSGAGSAIGLVSGGSATVGALRKRKEIFGLCLVLAGLPATQGLFGFVAYIIFSSQLTPNIDMLSASIVFGAGLGMALVNLISAIKMGQITSAGITSMGMGNDVFVNTLVLAAFPEFYAILGLVGGILMNGLIPAH
jgi:V/A-type H+-transporting ATPase subunit K